MTGYVDSGDNNVPALPGATNDKPGIAVYRHDTLGGWWRVCWLERKHARGCHWVRQTDYGPIPPRILDINAVATRILWHLPQGSRFPTDVGTWKIRYWGRTLTKRQMRQARQERR